MIAGDPAAWDDFFQQSLIPNILSLVMNTWQPHDVLLWDNCSVQHLATFDYQWPQHRRLMHRITVGGSVPF